jgi:hypothetical protein
MLFSMRPVPRLYKDKQLPVKESTLPAARKKRNAHHRKSLPSNMTEDS